MSTTPIHAVTGGVDPKQAAYDVLNALLTTSAAAAINPANTQEARDAAFDLRTATAAQLDALDQAVFTGNTIDLQAASSAMTPGMKDLKALQERIFEIGNDLKEIASILTGIDKALTELAALL